MCGKILSFICGVAGLSAATRCEKRDAGARGKGRAPAYFSVLPARMDGRAPAGQYCRGMARRPRGRRRPARRGYLERIRAEERAPARANLALAAAGACPGMSDDTRRKILREVDAGTAEVLRARHGWPRKGGRP